MSSDKDVDEILLFAVLQNDHLDPHPISPCASGAKCARKESCRRYQYFLEVQEGETCILPDPETCDMFAPSKAFHELSDEEKQELFKHGILKQHY